jgi:hypothetical protein
LPVTSSDQNWGALRYWRASAGHGEVPTGVDGGKECSVVAAHGDAERGRSWEGEVTAECGLGA